MGTKAVICSQCGMYFNATDYKECPYCSSGMVKPKKEKKKHPWWGRAPQAIATAETVEQETSPTDTTDVPSPQSASIISDNPQRSPSESGHTRAFSDLLDTWEADNTPKDIPEPTPASSRNLEKRIDSINKTTAKYISYSNGEVTYPVVGWLVSVKGVYYGKSFPLKSGINRVGRSSDFEIAMLLDDSVSHEVVVKIVYDPKKNTFAALPGESALCYINGNCIYEKTDLFGYEEIELGDSEKNRFVFVPFCGPNFTWSNYAPQE